LQSPGNSFAARRERPQWAACALQRMISLHEETESRTTRGGHNEE
jgi:hypothetical protein